MKTPTMKELEARAKALSVRGVEAKVSLPYPDALGGEIRLRWGHVLVYKGSLEYEGVKSYRRARRMAWAILDVLEGEK